MPSHLRGSSSTSNHSTQSSVLQSRINEKKVEFENLKQLRDLSAGLAGQMQQLEDKLATLSNGTEAVAAVLSNWHNVLRAIHMASGGSFSENARVAAVKTDSQTAKMPKPKDADDASEPQVPLPQTLVRIPIQQAEAAQRELDAEQSVDE